MKLNKKIIISVIAIICIICIICIIVILKISQKKDKSINISDGGQNEVQEKNQDESNIKIEYKFQKVKNATHFFTVENCIQEFENNKDFIAKEMGCQYGEYIQQFIVSGYENTEARKNKETLFYRVFLDNHTNSYKVEKLQSNNYSTVDDIEIIESPKEITEDNNKITYKRYTIEDLCRKYLRYYNDLELNNTEEAYQLLDEEYRIKRFPNGFDDFRKYIEDSKEILQQTSLSRYSEKPQVNGEISTYTLKDQYNRFYIIKEDSIMNFTISLDEYTITNNEFKKNYNQLKEAEKASANIGFFIQMINTKDYGHAYEKLSDGFKNNYFKTQEDFEKYIKENWYSNLGYDISHYQNEGKIYIYDIKLKNLKGREIETMEKTLNIRLKEDDNTDYEISFNM